MNLPERLSQDFALQQQARSHYVYYLIWEDKVIYVGRSINPKGRRTAFETRHGFRPQQKIFNGQELQAACAKELREIRKLHPKYNKYVASSPCMFGLPQSDKHREVTRRITSGRKLTAAHKAKLWRDRPRPIGKLNWFYGKRHTLATIDKIREATRVQFADPVKHERHRQALLKSIAERRAAGIKPGGRPKGGFLNSEARAKVRAGIQRRIAAGLPFGRPARKR